MLIRFSVLIATIVIGFNLMDVFRIYKLYDRLKENLVFNNLINSVSKGSLILSQDDFRVDGYKVIAGYVNKNIERAVYSTLDRLSENEKNISINKLENKVFGLGSGISEKRSISKISNISRRYAENKERNYFFVSNNIYHRNKKCINIEIGNLEVYSGMEACAMRGSYPCKFCILGGDFTDG